MSKLFKTKKFLIIEGVILILIIISFLMGRFDLYHNFSTCWPSCPQCEVYFLGTTQCSNFVIFARVGFILFSSVFIISLFAFLIYRLISRIKNQKNLEPKN